MKRTKGTPKLDKIVETLTDKFDGTRETRVEKAETVCSPVGIGMGSTAPSTASLTCYKIKDEEEHDEEEHEEGHPKFERRDVVVENQFGDQQALTLKKPKLLCVPSTTVVPEGL